MLRGCRGRGVLGMGPGVMEVGEPNNPITPRKLHVVVSVCEWEESEKIHYLSVWRIRNKSKRSLCLWESVCESRTVALTCCAGHTSHSGDLLIQDIRCRLSTDHRPPLVPWTAAERYTRTVKKLCKTFNVWIIPLMNEVRMSKHWKENITTRQREWNAREMSCWKKSSVYVCHGRDLNVMGNKSACLLQMCVCLCVCGFWERQGERDESVIINKWIRGFKILFSNSCKLTNPSSGQTSIMNFYSMYNHYAEQMSWELKNRVKIIVYREQELLDNHKCFLLYKFVSVPLEILQTASTSMVWTCWKQIL